MGKPKMTFEAADKRQYDTGFEGDMWMRLIQLPDGMEHFWVRGKAGESIHIKGEHISETLVDFLLSIKGQDPGFALEDADDDQGEYVEEDTDWELGPDLMD